MEPIAPDLFTLEGNDPTLIGGRDRGSGRIVFPLPADRARFEPVKLPRHGTIWSWTVQRFRPKSPPYAGPDAFTPYAIAYVELPGAVIVETRLTGFDLAALKVGVACRLVIEDFGGKASFAFAPLDRAETEVADV